MPGVLGSCSSLFSVISIKCGLFHTVSSGLAFFRVDQIRGICYLDWHALSLNLPEALVQSWILVDTSGFGLASSHAGQGVPWLEAWCLLGCSWARDLSVLTRDRASCLQEVRWRTA